MSFINPTPLPPLWVCGNASIELFDATATIVPGQTLWSWNSQSAPGLPAGRRRWFEELDECKPADFESEACLLVTASTHGGAAVVRRSDGAYLFALHASNAHSIELLPGGWIAVAASMGTDKLLIQHASAGVNAEGAHTEFPLLHGHGAVFEHARRRLWVSGAQFVRLYAWEADARAFRCELIKELKLPDNGAHDLQPNRRTGGMLISTHRSVWQIDAATLDVAPFQPLAELNDVKGLSIEAATGTLAYTKGNGATWWTDQIEFIAADGARRRETLPGRRLYKVRWDQPRGLD